MDGGSHYADGKNAVLGSYPNNLCVCFSFGLDAALTMNYK
jgi:hypothetical protein